VTVTVPADPPPEQTLGLPGMVRQAYSRVAGAPLIAGNHIRLLRDAGENYPAWLEAIHAARRHVHFENYIFREDDVGRRFAEALRQKAAAGIPVRLIYDWMGGFGKTSSRFWNDLRASGVDVRCYNPPRLDSPLGWLSRDHRKMLAVDGRIGFVSGLCIGEMWTGVPARGLPPWRDTGVEIRGPALGEIERAFAQVWTMIGPPLPKEELGPWTGLAPAGDVSLRIVASVPATAGMLRLDQMVAALARQRLWLTDAYYAGTAAYVQALRSAARDGVDVRLLVPGVSDIPLLKLLSRAGYRPLLEAGVRVFEWNGPMIHAKTAVADGHWARVGSTNLNISSWLNNCELDVFVEDEAFAREMEEMFRQDLQNATEIVLNARRRISVPPRPLRRNSHGGGSVGRATAGAIRIGNAVGAAFTDRRVLEPIESRLTAIAGAVFLVLAALIAIFPRVFAGVLLVLLLWLALAMLTRSFRLRRAAKKKRRKKRS